jgi:hypothetical protein
MTDNFDVRLPVIYCPGCRSQLVNFLYIDLPKGELIDLWCARDRPPGTVAALNSADDAHLAGAAPALDPVDAIALLVRLGARIAD